MEPTDLVAGLILGVVGYASTNLDNLLLVGALLSGARDRRPVFLGFLLAGLAVIAFAGLFAFLPGILPASTLGWLGVLPIALGVRLLVRSRRTTEAREPARQVGIAATGTLLIGNSADTVVVFASLFAESERLTVLGLLAGFLLAGLTWALLLLRVTTSTSLGERLRPLAERVAPFVMIAIGLYVIADTPTDLV